MVSKGKKGGRNGTGAWKMAVLLGLFSAVVQCLESKVEEERACVDYKYSSSWREDGKRFKIGTWRQELKEKLLNKST